MNKRDKNLVITFILLVMVIGLSVCAQERREFIRVFGEAGLMLTILMLFVQVLVVGVIGPMIAVLFPKNLEADREQAD